MQPMGVCVCVCRSWPEFDLGTGGQGAVVRGRLFVRNGEREGWEAGLVRWMDGLMDGRQMAG